MNRRTEDGRPILIDGLYDDAYHIHGSTGAVAPDDLAAVIEQANQHAADALTVYLAGSWSLDIDDTLAQSDALPGKPTAPITVEMEVDGRFTIAAPEIAFDLMGLQATVGLTATGELRIEARMEDDRVQYQAVAANIGIDHTKADIGGIFDAGPLLQPLIVQLLAAGTQPQDVSIEPHGADEKFILVGDGVTHVLKRRRPTGTRKFLRPLPFRVKQPNRMTCWATAMGSFLNTLSVGNMPPEAKAYKQDYLTTDAVIQRMIDQGAADGVTYVEAGSHMLTGPHALDLWKKVCSVFSILEEPSLPPLKVLTMEIIKSYIDSFRYVLIMFHDTDWNPKPGQPGYNPDDPLWWHVVICYGYDTQTNMIMVMDPAIGGNLVVAIKPDCPYIIVGQAALPYTG